jgi:hypothetical protein
MVHSSPNHPVCVSVCKGSIHTAARVLDKVVSSQVKHKQLVRASALLAKRDVCIYFELLKQQAVCRSMCYLVLLVLPTT